MEIRKAKPSDAERIYEIIVKCKVDMKRKGEEQWPEHYPTMENVAGDIKGGSLYVVEDGEENEKVVACMSIDTNQPKPYFLVKWKLDDKNPLMIHRIAVLPSEQGKGIAGKLVEFAENFARENNHKSIRLDTYAKNISSNAFYRKKGYVHRGVIRIPEHMLGEYNAYEKILR
ncbi:MAG: GNAT family N-acetyltransferase [Candidatus Pacearchaeota archaeon]|jgi:GNAT superfamily N-acetyltransferase